MMREPRGSVLSAPVSLAIFAAALFLLAPPLGAIGTPSRPAVPGDSDPEAVKEAYARISLFFDDIGEEEARERLYRKVSKQIQGHLDLHPEGEVAELARFQLAECSWYLGEKEKAAEGWISVLEVSDFRIVAKAHIRLADHLYAEKKFEEALGHFKSGGEHPPDKDEGLRCRLFTGICHFRLDQRDKAKAVLKMLQKDVETGVIAVEVKKYLDRLRPEEERGAKESIQKYLKDFEKHKKTGNKDRKNEIAEKIRTNLEDWDGIDHANILKQLRAIVGEKRHPFAGLAARELVQIGTPEALRDVVAVIGEKGHRLRPSALRSIVREKVFIDDSIVQGIFEDRVEKDTGLRLSAADYIALRDSKSSVEKLYGEIMVPGDKRVKINTQLNAGILRALRRHKSAEAAASLREIVGDQKAPPIHRIYAIDALGHMKDRQAVEAMIPLLQEKQLDIVSTAAEALGRTGDQRAAEPLLVLLRKKPKVASLLSSLLRGLDRLEVSQEDEELFLSFAKSKDAAIRVLAHALLRQTAGKGAWKKFEDSISDKSWQVRWHSIRAFGQAPPSADHIQVLIDRLPKEGGRLKYQILKYLHRLTGEDLGLDPKVWKDWWKSAREGYDPTTVKLAEMALGPEKGKTVTASELVPKYFSLKVSSKNAIFVIDVSGSMVGEITVPKKGGTGSAKQKKMEVAKRELIALLRTFKKDTRFNIIWFDQRFAPLWKVLTPASKSNVGKAVKFVRGLQPRTATNIFDSLAHAIQDPKVDTVYFLSDGDPTAGKYTNPDDILREIKNLNYTRKVAIHTIFLGGTSAFMRSLAEQNNGKYIPVAK